jgi:hypothetical protein
VAGLKGGGSRRRKRQRRASAAGETYGGRSEYGGRFGREYVGHGIDRVMFTAKKCGSHYFDKDTMRFFGSRLQSKTHPSADGKCTYFVTSERRDSSERRYYSVRRQCGCNISTVGTFQGYKSAKGAHAAAARAAKGRKR